MLQKLNERVQGLIAWIIIGTIAITIALLGIDYYLQFHEGAHPAVEVNGTSISKQVFDLNFRRIRQLRDLTQMTPAAEIQLKKQVLDAMVVNQVSVDYAHKNGFYVSAEQANAAIMHIPQFQEDGRFSAERYQQALNGAMFTPQSLQDEVRQGMLLNQQRFAFIGTAFALPNEIQKFVKLYMQTRDYDYLRIPATKFVNAVRVSDSEVDNYYKQHQNEFVSAEKVSVDYIQLSIEDIKQAIHVSDEQIKQYYDENNSQLNQSFSDQSKGSKNTAQQEKNYNEVKETIRQQLLSELAQTQYSRLLEQLTELSFQSPDSLVSTAKALKLSIKQSESFSRFGGNEPLTKNKAVIEAAFSHDVMSLGNNSEPIQINNNSVVVLRVNKRYPAMQKSLLEVKPIIVAQLSRKKSEIQAQKLGQELLSLNQQPKVRSAILEKYDLHWRTITNASRDSDQAPSIVNEEAFAIKSVGHEVGDQMGGGAYVIIHLNQINDGKVSNLDKEQFASLSQQIQTSYGVLDYDLYVNQLMKQAKIVRY